MSRDGKVWTSLLEGNVYSLNREFLSESLFNTAYAYKVRLVISDFFGEVIKERIIPVGYTILNFKSNGRGFAIGKVSEKDGFEVDMESEFYEDVIFHKAPSGILDSIFPIGSIYVNSTNKNPSENIGGEWSLVDKDWSTKAIEKTYSSSAATLELVAARTSDSLRIRIKVTLKQTIADTQVFLGNINWSDLGVISAIPYGLFNLVGASDGGNSLVTVHLQHTGRLDSIDTYTAELNSGDVFYINVTVNAFDSDKDDAACNKFYFKRIS